jgi:hypothetical protein
LVGRRSFGAWEATTVGVSCVEEVLAAMSSHELFGAKGAPVIVPSRFQID